MARQLLPSKFDLAGGVSSPRIEHFQEAFTLSTDGVTTDMAVDGSVTQQDFIVEAEDEGGVYKEVCAIWIWIHSGFLDISTATELRRFGDATTANTPLDNGLEVVYFRGGVETDTIGHTMTTLGELVVSFSDVLSAVDADSLGVDITRCIYVFDESVRLYPGTGDYLGIHIRDDLTGLTRMHATCKGRREVA